MKCKNCGKETQHISGYCEDCLKQFKKDIPELDKKINLTPDNANLYYQRGIAKNALEKYKEAIKDFDKSIELNPYSAETYNGRGIAKTHLKRYEDAINDFDKAIELNPYNAEAYGNLGTAKYNLKQYEDAIKDFDKMLELDPDSAEAYYNRGVANINLKQYEDAIKDFNKVIELAPDSAEAYYNRGFININLKRYEDAIKDFDKAIELGFNTVVTYAAVTYNNRGFAKINLKRYEDAIKDFDKAIELDPNHVKAYVNRGDAKSFLKQHEDAIKDFDKVIELDPNKEEAYGRRGFVKNILKQYEDAIKDFDKAIELDPNDVTAYNNRGSTKTILKRYEEAIKDFDKAIELDPDNDMYYAERGKSKQKAGKNKEALKDLDKAIEISPEPLYYRNRGKIKEALKKYKEAFEDYCMSVKNSHFKNLRERRLDRIYEESLAETNEYIKSHKKNADAYHKRGFILSKLRRYEEAIKDFDKAIETGSKKNEIFQDRGEAKLRLGLYEEALNDFNYTIKKQKKKKTDTYFLRGITYNKLKKFREARNDFDSAIEADNSMPDYYNERGSLYSDYKEYEKALDDFNKAIELDNENANYFANRANANFRLGLHEKRKIIKDKHPDNTENEQLKKAIKDYDMAILLEHDNAAFYFQRALAKQNLNLYDEMFEDFNRAIGMEPKHTEYYYNRGKAKKNLGLYNESIKDFDKAIELEDNNPDYYNERGVAYSNITEYKKAIKDYGRAIELDNNNADYYANRANANLWLGQQEIIEISKEGNYPDNTKNKRWEKAIKDYDRAIELNNNNANYYYQRAQAKDYIGHAEKEVINDLDRAIKLNNNNINYYYQRARFKFRLNLYSEAIDDLIKVMKTDSDNRRARHLIERIMKESEQQENIKINDKMGDAELKLGNLEKALSYYEQVIEQKPDSPQPYTKIGQVYAEDIRCWKDMHETLEKHFMKALKEICLKKKLFTDYFDKIPEDNLNISSLSGILEKMGWMLDTVKHDIHGCDKILTECYNIALNKCLNNISLKDSFIKTQLEQNFNEIAENCINLTFFMEFYDDSYLNRYFNRTLEDSFNKAMENFNKAIELQNDYANGYLQRGICYEEFNQTDKALEDYNTAIKFDSNNKEAYRHRGNIYFKQNKYKQALANYTEYLKLDPDNTEIQYSKEFAEIQVYGQKNKPENNSEEIIINDKYKYKVSKVGNRTIYIPNVGLKYMQYVILDTLRKIYPFKLNIRETAKIHTNQKYLLKLDIEHFFDSVHISKIDRVIEKVSKHMNNDPSFEEIKTAVTIEDKLPTGACTSPHIANACVKDIDEEITQFCKENFVNYSRYMDDMFFSADEKDILKKTEEFVEELLADNSLKINENKIKYVSDNKKQVIMGLLVNKEQPCLTKEIKRKIRSVLHKYMTGQTDNENYVTGYLSYVYSVDEDYLKTLKKYYDKYKEKFKTSEDRLKLINKVFKNLYRPDKQRNKTINVDNIKP